MGYRVFLFMVAFWYPDGNDKMLTLVNHFSFLIYRPPLELETREIGFLPHPDNQSQRVMKILGNLSGSWMETFINEVYDTFIRITVSGSLPGHSEIEHQHSVNDVWPYMMVNLPCD
jgi:hypothetical protein